MILTSVTMVTPYALQGFLQHNAPDDVSAIVWTVEAVSWGFRALVEVWAVIYLAQTVTKHWGQTLVVWTLKLTLIALIAATLGPVIATIGYDQHITETTGDVFWVWAFGVAAYAPLMMAAAAVGYKIMPHDIDTAQRIGALEEALSSAEAEREARTEEAKASASKVARLRKIVADNEIKTERTIAALQAEIEKEQVKAAERARAIKALEGMRNGAERSAPSIETANAGKTQAYQERASQAQRLQADGKTAQEIATEMQMQLRTVRGYLANGASQEEQR
jgi:DNA-binding NarL/FixJ family response regulator